MSPRIFESIYSEDTDLKTTNSKIVFKVMRIKWDNHIKQHNHEKEKCINQQKIDLWTWANQYNEQHKRRSRNLEVWITVTKDKRTLERILSQKTKGKEIHKIMWALLY